MKKTLLISLLLLLSLPMLATHNRAGEITYRALGNNRYEVTITTYTKDSAPADRCVLDINWGDNTKSTLRRINGSADPSSTGDCVGTFQGENIGNDVRKNIYRGEHTYATAGRYRLWFEDMNRNAGVANIPQSVNKPFYVDSELVIAPGLGSNSSPILTYPPIDDGCLNRRFEHNPGAVDTVDGDSLSYELVLCREAGGAEIPTTYDPTMVQAPLTIDPVKGDLIWDSPQQIGQYNFAIKITEWRRTGNGRYDNIGFVVRDLQVNINNCNNRPPEIEPVGPFCIEAGQSLNFDVTATDPDMGPSPNFATDIVTLTAFGAPFEVTNPADTFYGQASQTVTANFNWNTSCNHVRKLPYMVTFRAEDDPSPRGPNETKLVDLYTTEITVVAPAPKNPMAVGLDGGIALNWDTSFCRNAIGYKIYRREGSYGFVPDECETGVPEYTGYELIGSTPHVDSVNYLDTVDLLNGVEYCYMVIAHFEDGAESYASEEFCAAKRIDGPLITNVDILNTDPQFGGIDIKWTPPPSIDSANFPPPYSYKLYRSDSIDGTNFIEIQSLPTYQDTTFRDTLLNTQDLGYNYKVEFYSGTSSTLAAVSDLASSVFLQVSPDDESNILRFRHFTPWQNDTFVVYREQPTGSGVFEILDTALAATFTDTGLVNGDNYCYKVLSIGRYTAPSTPFGLLNNSQIACGSPLDTNAPCPPEAYVANEDCENDELRIEWGLSVDSGCTNDISYFNVYYKASRDDAFPEQPLASGITNFYYEISGRPVAGCYAVTAVDDADQDANGEANESRIGPVMCIEACPLINFPNVFTPNSDGSNDFFTASAYKDVAELNIQIFNRWGTMVYESSNPNDFFENGWDGTDMNSGQACSDGVYYFVAHFTPISIIEAEEKVEKGFVHLFRN